MGASSCVFLATGKGRWSCTPLLSAAGEGGEKRLLTPLGIYQAVCVGCSTPGLGSLLLFFPSLGLFI